MTPGWIGRLTFVLFGAVYLGGICAALAVHEDAIALGVFVLPMGLGFLYLVADWIVKGEDSDRL